MNVSHDVSTAYSTRSGMSTSEWVSFNMTVPSGLLNVSADDVVITVKESCANVGKQNVQSASKSHCLLKGYPVCGQALFLNA